MPPASNAVSNAESESATPEQFQGDIHRLRGVAILLIVATHCVTFFSWDSHSAALWMAQDLFDNSSLIFMFISGYLFQHTSRNFQYTRYLKTKARNVVLPYAIAATPGIVYVLFFDPARLSALGLDGWPSIEKAAYMLIYGGAQLNYALWFVPVICLYYLASPLLLKVFNRPIGLPLLLVLVPLSVLMHRPTYEHGHNLMLALYFLSAYAMGMLCSKYHDQVVKVLDRHVIELQVLSATIIVAHVFLSNHHGNYNVATFRAFDHSDGWIDWLFIQKIVLTFALWALMRRLSTTRLSFIDSLATVSFTVYFLHLYVLCFIANLPHAAGLQVGVLAFCALLAFVIGLPAFLAAGVRKLMPRWSRPLIGS